MHINLGFITREWATSSPLSSTPSSDLFPFPTFYVVILFQSLTTLLLPPQTPREYFSGAIREGSWRQRRVNPKSSQDKKMQQTQTYQTVCRLWSYWNWAEVKGRKTEKIRNETCEAKKTHFALCILYRSLQDVWKVSSTIEPLLIMLTFTLAAILRSLETILKFKRKSKSSTKCVIDTWIYNCHIGVEMQLSKIRASF